MNAFTKVNVRQDLYDQLKIMAAADNRSLTNYVEQLLRRHVEGNDLANTSPDTNKSVSNPPYNATLSNLEGKHGDSND